MQPDSRLLDSILQRKLSLVGQILREESGIDRALLLGSVYGPRGQGPGRPKTRFIEDVVRVCGGVCVAVECVWRWRWQEIETDGGSSCRRPRQIGHDPTIVDDDVFTIYKMIYIN